MNDGRNDDNTSKLYNVSRILDANLESSEDLYKKYSPVFLSTNFALNHGGTLFLVSLRRVVHNSPSSSFWDTHLKWWAFIICIAIPLVWTVPIGIIFATTNIQIGRNVFTEFVIGYMLPGRPVAMMLFKAYG
ncbi:hypothetical protein DSL72_009377 [Monilinia vaccinii-corymbosi]|uniref:Uncharacterized protein n=1 Tax=Monilinia vaccinii-corymbosi TaxID=61207 RepID=A0A8A3PQK8_9HELO|nr:hypothetical protein DSL72_009377 [Monilinia vaccinii-corymbosi]